MSPLLQFPIHEKSKSTSGAARKQLTFGSGPARNVALEPSGKVVKSYACGSRAYDYAHMSISVPIFSRICQSHFKARCYAA
jgi:hypothetical protein